MNGQSLQGKWLLTRPGDTYTIPTNMIMEIKDDSLIYYDFDKEYSAAKIKINPDKTLTESGSIKEINFINQDRLRLSRTGIRNGKYSIFHEEYVRLKPTQTKLSPGEIENLKFQFDYNGSQFKVRFNEELTGLKILKMVGEKGRERMLLEKIDSTYFVSIYKAGERKNIIPIQKVSEKTIIIYGTPEKPYEIHGSRID